jgi:hypothetical protein
MSLSLTVAIDSTHLQHNDNMLAYAMPMPQHVPTNAVTIKPIQQCSHTLNFCETNVPGQVARKDPRWPKDDGELRIGPRGAVSEQLVHAPLVHIPCCTMALGYSFA